MNWKHTFKHVDSSEALKEYAENLFEKVGHLLLKDSQWQIFYSKGKHHDCCVDITVQNGTGYFKATAHSDSFYLAVDDAAEKLSKQFQKKKEKLQHHKDYKRSKEGRFERLNERLEYDNSLLPWKRQA
jgi:putative sigma-54 modulation protein